MFLFSQDFPVMLPILLLLEANLKLLVAIRVVHLVLEKARLHVAKTSGLLLHRIADRDETDAHRVVVTFWSPETLLRVSVALLLRVSQRCLNVVRRVFQRSTFSNESSAILDVAVEEAMLNLSKTSKTFLLLLLLFARVAVEDQIEAVAFLSVL